MVTDVKGISILDSLHAWNDEAVRMYMISNESMERDKIIQINWPVPTETHNGP